MGCGEKFQKPNNRNIEGNVISLSSSLICPFSHLRFIWSYSGVTCLLLSKDLVTLEHYLQFKNIKWYLLGENTCIMVALICKQLAR